MANQVQNLSGIAIGSIEKINGATDANIEKINGLEFAGTVDPSTTTLTNHQFNGTDSVEHTSICYDPDNEFIIVSYRDADDSNYGKIRAASISGTTLTWGTETTFSSATTTNTGLCYNTSDNRIMIAWSGPSSNTIYVQAAEVNADKSFDFESESASTVDSGGDGGNQSVGYGMIEYNPTYNTATVAYENGGDSGHNYVAAVSISSGSALDVGTAVEFDDTSEELYGQSYDPDLGKTVLVYDNGTKVGARVMTQGGTGNRTITMQTEYLYGTNSGLTIQEYYGGMPVAYDTTLNRHHVLLYDDAASAAKIVYFVVNSSDYEITWSSTSASVSSGTASNNETGGGIAYNAARNRIITYGATSSATSSDYNFEYHTAAGTAWGGTSGATDGAYTSQGSATIIEEGLRTRSIHVPSVQVNDGDFANKTPLVYSDVGGSTGGGRVKLLDAGA